MNFINQKIVVVGAGGWGTALAMLLHNSNKDVTLYSHDTELISNIQQNKCNTTYLPDIAIPETLKLTSDKSIFDSAKIVVNTVPTQFIKTFYKDLGIDLTGKYIINGSKGIDIENRMLISSIFTDILNVTIDHYCVLTGPSHAEEVARRIPTAVVSASVNYNLAKNVQELFSGEYFRVYSGHDFLGCEIGGALKNVIAIAVGILVGMGYGDNTRAAVITRGLAEISRIGTRLGANPLTFSGLSGLGDLFVTCDSLHSRNRSFGVAIGKGEKPSDILKTRQKVAEGAFTAKAVHTLSKELNIEMPICEQVYQIIYEDKDPKEAVRDLFNRENKLEIY